MKNFFIRACHKISSVFYEKKYSNIFMRDESRDIFAQEENKKIIWPQNKKFACNIQFDDFCAKSKKNGPYDFGGSFGRGINLAFDAFLSAHPEVQVTIFAIPCPTFKNYKGIYYGNTDDLFNLSNPEYKNLTEWMKAKKDRVEIACHGYAHIQYAKPFFLGPAEFEFASIDDAKKSIAKALDIFAQLEVPIQGFRPPAWGIGENSNFALLEALQKSNFEYVSLSSPYCGLNWHHKRVSNVYPEYYNGMLTIPQNISLAWDMHRIMAAVDKVASMNGVVTLMGHYSGEYDWMEDGIGEKNFSKISAVLEYMYSCYGKDNIWHATLAEIAHFWHNQPYEHRD